MSVKGKEDDVSVLSREGYQLLKQSAYAEAAARFEQVLEIEPGNCYALVGLGDIARRQTRPRDAVSYYESCLEHSPDNAFALFGLADSYRALRRHRDALRVWERYLLHDSENVTVLTRVADAYRKVRDRNKSRDLYRKVLDIEPENPYALIGLGHLHYDFREYEEALACWMQMYEIGGRSVDIRVLTSIGNSHRKLKDFRAAIPFFNEALEKEPGNFYALFGLADCYRGLNDPEQSLRYWNDILDNDPTNRVILTRAGDAHRSMGELEQAKRCYLEALEIGEDLYAQLGLAIIARSQGDYAQSIALLEALKRTDPDAYRVYIELAATYAEAGRPRDAIEILTAYSAGVTDNFQIQELIERYREM